MNVLLYLILPIATIILAIVWQRVVRSPILVAATAFAIYLIVVYVIDPTLLIFAIIYTILAFIAAVIAKFIAEKIVSGGLFRNITTNNITTNTMSANDITANNLDTDNLNVNNDDNNGNCSCENRYYRWKSRY